MFYQNECILIKMVIYIYIYIYIHIPSCLLAVRLASNNFGTVVEPDCQHNAVMQTHVMILKIYYELRTFNQMLGFEISCQ